MAQLDQELVSQVMEMVRGPFSKYKMIIISGHVKGNGIEILFQGPKYVKYAFRLQISVEGPFMRGDVLSSVYDTGNNIVDAFQVPMSHDPIADLEYMASLLGQYAAKPLFNDRKEKILDSLTEMGAKELDQKMDQAEVERDWPEAIKEDKMRFSNVHEHFMSKYASSNITTQNVGAKAIGLVRSMLDNYSLPNAPSLSYSGLRSGRMASNSSSVLDGVVTINATLRTASNIGISFDIPVEIRDGKMIDPSVVVIDGRARIIAQSTFSDLVNSNSIKETMPVRSMYSAPLDTQVAADLYSNRMNVLRTDRGLFSVEAARTALKRAIRGQAIDTEPMVASDDSSVQKLVKDLYSATETDNGQLIDRILNELDILVKRGLTTQDDINAAAWEYRNSLEKEAASGVPGQHDRPRPSKTPGAPKLPKQPSSLKPPKIPKIKNKPSLGRLCTKCNHAPCICPNKRKKSNLVRLELDAQHPLANIDGAYLAGGAVRDMLRGYEPKDYDYFFNSRKAFEDGYAFLVNDAGGKVTRSTHNSVHVELNGKTYELLRYGFFNSPDDAVRTFDFTACQACMVGKDVYLTANAINDIRSSTLRLDNLINVDKTLARARRFIEKKGFIDRHNVIDALALVVDARRQVRISKYAQTQPNTPNAPKTIAYPQLVSGWRLVKSSQPPDPWADYEDANGFVICINGTPWVALIMDAATSAAYIDEVAGGPFKTFDDALKAAIAQAQVVITGTNPAKWTPQNPLAGWDGPTIKVTPLSGKPMAEPDIINLMRGLKNSLKLDEDAAVAKAIAVGASGTDTPDASEVKYLRSLYKLAAITVAQSKFVHEGSEDIIAKVNEEVNQMRHDGLQDIDIKLAVSKKYGDDVMNAVFEKTAK